MSEFPYQFMFKDDGFYRITMKDYTTIDVVSVKSEDQEFIYILGLDYRNRSVRGCVAKKEIIKIIEVYD